MTIDTSATLHNRLSGPGVSASARLSGWRTRLLLAGVVLGVGSPSAAQERSVNHTDKVMHAAASALIVDAVWLSASLFDQPLVVRAGAGVGVAAAAGLAKEAADAAGFGTPDVADLVFDAFGIGIGVAIALVVETVAAKNVDESDDEVGELVGDAAKDGHGR